MKRIAALAIFLVALTPWFPASAISKDDLPTISMTGAGVVKASADIVLISTGVVSDAATARAALDANTAAMSKVISELKASGIAAKDIQTTNFAVNPRYQRFKDGRAQKIIGYRVTNSVNITVHDIAKLGAILDQVVTLGSNQIGGITFGIDEPGNLRDEARRRATKDALSRAEIYAEAAGVKLGSILSINETTQRPMPRPAMARMAMEANSADVPIESGELSLEVRVSIVWEIE